MIDLTVIAFTDEELALVAESLAEVRHILAADPSGLDDTDAALLDLQRRFAYA